MRQRSRVLATMTAAVLVFGSVGMAGATHGGSDTVREGSILLAGPRLSPCSPEALLAAVHGVTQYIVDIPESTWNHEFAVTSPVARGGFLLEFWAKVGGSCTRLAGYADYLSEGNWVTTGEVSEGATHAVLLVFDYCNELLNPASYACLDEGALPVDFVLTIDNDS